MTDSGDNPGKPCALPFKYLGKTYSECIWEYGDEPWCLTEVDSDGIHVDGQWGYCGLYCPIKLGLVSYLRSYLIAHTSSKALFHEILTPGQVGVLGTPALPHVV